jgi:HAD superfamily hydrolase (TIGR01509 family)
MPERPRTSDMPPRPTPKAVVFDLDGLMFNTEELYEHVGSEILRRRGRLFEAELMDAMMGRPAAAALRLMIDWHALDCTIDELAAETDEIFATLLGEQLDVMPGLVDLLDRLEAAGVPKAIATSSGAAFAAEVLDRFALRPRFRFVLTCEDITHGKPDPEVYLLAARRLGVPPGAMVVLEDSQNGCRAAVAAGALAVAVPSGHSRRHDFAGAALVAETLADSRLHALLGLADD